MLQLEMSMSIFDFQGCMSLNWYFVSRFVDDSEQLILRRCIRVSTELSSNSHGPKNQ